MRHLVSGTECFCCRRLVWGFPVVLLQLQQSPWGLPPGVSQGIDPRAPVSRVPSRSCCVSGVVDLQSGGQFDWLLDAPVAINKVMIGSVVLSKAFLPNAETRRWARGARQDREAR